jgi:hypothetical protein
LEAQRMGEVQSRHSDASENSVSETWPDLATTANMMGVLAASSRSFSSSGVGGRVAAVLKWK